MFEKKFRNSKQRRIILEELRKVTSHPRAEEIYEKVRQKVPRVSLGTIYRNLKMLKEQGEIIELSYGKSSSRFDGNPENHYHFQCCQCGRVFDIKEPLETSLEEKFNRKTDFDIFYHRLEFYGLCLNCKKG